MMLLWACAGVPLGIYNILKFNLALQIQPQILTTLSLVTFAQCIYYERVSPRNHFADVQRYPFLKCVIIVLPIAIVMVGIEVAGVFGLRVNPPSP